MLFKSETQRSKQDHIERLMRFSMKLFSADKKREIFSLKFQNFKIKKKCFESYLLSCYWLSYWR